MKAQNNRYAEINKALLVSNLWENCTCEQKVVLITILLQMTSCDCVVLWRLKQYELEAGQAITSVADIFDLCGAQVSTKKIRLALKKFEQANIISIKTTNQYSIITLEDTRLLFGGKDKKTSQKASKKEDEKTSRNIQQGAEKEVVKTVVNKKKTSKKDIEKEGDKARFFVVKNSHDFEFAFSFENYKTCNRFFGDKRYLTKICKNLQKEEYEIKDYVIRFFVEMENAGRKKTDYVDAQKSFFEWMAIFLKR